MTEEEVEQIYNYLHEHYEYQDGALRAKTKRCGPKIGRSIGSVIFDEGKNRAVFVAGLRIDGKLITKAMSTWIFIYHNKFKPGFIKHKDGNPANNRIENLINFPQENKNKYRCCFVLCGSNKMYVGDVDTKEDRDLICKQGKELYQNGMIDKSEIKQRLKKLFPQIRNRPKSYSGLKGVEKNNGENRWQARITISGRRQSLGTYDTIEEAHAAYLKAKEEYKNAI